MSDQIQGQSVEAAEPESHLLRYVSLGVAVLYVIVSLYFIVEMGGRIGKLEDGQKAATEQNAQLLKRFGITEASLQAASETQQQLASKLGSTQKEVVSRTSQLQRQQKEAEQRLTEETKQQVGAVSGEVAGVKTELGGTKTDLAATKSDLEATKSKLEKTIGDLGVQSGLIATNGQELQALRRLGERNYIEFKLGKTKAPQRVGDITLMLKNINLKKNMYTVEVMADDKLTVKKDKNVNEPVQFYSSKARQPYEIVVNQVQKDQIVGYLSTPKEQSGR